MIERKQGTAHAQEFKDKVLAAAREIVEDGETGRGWIARLAREHSMSYTGLQKWLYDAKLIEYGDAKEPETETPIASKVFNMPVRPGEPAQPHQPEPSDRLELLAALGELYIENRKLRARQ